ncbi:MAG: insulinase family protein [Endomicrobiales bacterium]|nr:insulinase family protein [Endomicrobiales bacterium]
MNESLLSNGSKLIHREIKTAPLATVQVFFKTGIGYEEKSNAGISYFTHMLLFQGTTSMDAAKLSEEIESIGGNVASDIAYDYSYAGITLLSENFDKACSLLSDILTNPAFENDEIEKERYNILASLEARKDRIFNSANDLFLEKFYGPENPYSWPETGKKETISKIKRDDILKWHKEHYTSDGMIVVIFGDIDFETARKSAEKYFGIIAATKGGAKMTKGGGTYAGEHVQRNKKFNQAFIMIGYPSPEIHDHSFAPLKLLNSYLGGRMTGKLFMELREEMGLAYEVSSFYPTRTCTSRFVVYMGLDKKNTEKAKKRIYEIIEEIKQKPIEKKELDETKKYVKGVYLMDHQTVSKQAWYCGWWEIMGKGYAYDDEYMRVLSKLTPGDLKNAANMVFGERPLQVECIPE